MQTLGSPSAGGVGGLGVQVSSHPAAHPERVLGSRAEWKGEPTPSGCAGKTTEEKSSTAAGPPSAPRRGGSRSAVPTGSGKPAAARDQPRISAPPQWPTLTPRRISRLEVPAQALPLLTPRPGNGGSHLLARAQRSQCLARVGTPANAPQRVSVRRTGQH